MTKTKKTWFDSPSAAMEVSPNCPTMITSIIFNEALMSYWNEIGNAMVSISRRKARSFKKERVIGEGKDEITHYVIRNA